MNQFYQIILVVGSNKKPQEVVDGLKAMEQAYKDIVKVTLHDEDAELMSAVVLVSRIKDEKEEPVETNDPEIPISPVVD